MGNELHWIQKQEVFHFILDLYVHWMHVSVDYVYRSVISNF